MGSGEIVVTASFVRQHRPLLHLFLLALPLLAACLPEERRVARQIVAEWPEKRMVFIADERVGSVNVFLVGGGAPVRVAQSAPFSRAAVLDLQLDAGRGLLWVLGRDSIDVHAADGLALRKRVPLDARNVAALRLEDDGVALFDADGALLGRVDASRQVAVWRARPSMPAG